MHSSGFIMVDLVLFVFVVGLTFYRCFTHYEQAKVNNIGFLLALAFTLYMIYGKVGMYQKNDEIIARLEEKVQELESDNRSLRVIVSDAMAKPQPRP